MPRLMSFAKTVEQMRDQSKTNTRRLGWWFLKEGDLLWAVEKAMGLKKGEPVVRLCLIRVVKTCPQRLGDISQADVIAEGFPDWTPEQFIDFFCAQGKGPDGQVITPDTCVNSIYFQYLISN